MISTILATPAQAAEVPPGPTTSVGAPNPVDAYSSYIGQSTCDPTVKPGAQALLNMAIGYYGGRSGGITRACSVGGQSEHKEGRAFDWMVNVNNVSEKSAGDRFTNWLIAPGPDDKPGYNARRLGVMYVIWNRQIWSASSANQGWKPYNGASPHTDHVHVSMSWAGAYMRSSWWTGTAIPSDSSIRRYVNSVYGDLFNRNPDPAGMETWSKALSEGRGRVEVANSITYSVEYRSGLINGAYNDFLGRDADPDGMRNWLTAMGNGMTIQQMESGFLASEEYYQQNGSNNPQWVSKLYRHVLNRDAGPAEVQYWVDQLASGRSRSDVAMGFLISTERLTNVIDGYYVKLLGRHIDPVGQQSWVSAIQNGARTEAIIGGIIASDEYFANI